MTSELAAELNERIDELAHQLLGEPNRSLSTKQQLRFGSKGSIAVEIAGPKRGRWYDHEDKVGGDGLELVSRQLGLAKGEVHAWARDWLGHATVAVPNRDGQEQSTIGIAPSPSETSDRVTAIVSQTEDAKGTPAEVYLRKRGIAISRLSDCTRFRRNAYCGYSALVALATNMNGTVQAVQQIYLTEDGCKAPVPVQKRTNKAQERWSETAAVRLPGKDPLVLCEGVETALSVWQATCFQTWACLGIANLGRAPVPKGVPVIVARDGDPPGSKADGQLHKAVARLRRRGHEVGVAAPPEGQDFNDLLQKAGAPAVQDAVVKALPATDKTSWRSGLVVNKHGEPRAILANAIHALRHAPEWVEVLWHDEFTTATVARRRPPWNSDTSHWQESRWGDHDDALTAEWLQHHGILVTATTAGQAVETVARERCFHPVRSYLETLHWDRTSRIDTWLSTYLGAPDTPYTRAVGTRWLVAAIARIQEPGCKADCALVLEGPQGIGKSSVVRVLGGPWHSDRLSELGSKDAALELNGVWIVEIAELDSMSRAESSTIKAFMSRSHDRYRPPYGKRVIELPRQCVFCGSVNPEGGYLKDATGGRRFWPVNCGTIDIAALERDRDQLWAEALDRYHAGQPWWLETPQLEALASEQQSDRYQGDVWEEPIRRYLDNTVDRTGIELGQGRPRYSPRTEPLDDVSVAEVMEHALGIEKNRWTQSDQNRIARCLISMGFKQYRPRRDGKRERRYRRHRPSGDGR